MVWRSGSPSYARRGSGRLSSSTDPMVARAGRRQHGAFPAVESAGSLSRLTEWSRKIAERRGGSADRGGKAAYPGMRIFPVERDCARFKSRRGLRPPMGEEDSCEVPSKDKGSRGVPGSLRRP